jgi:hypothetical protein
VFIAFDNVLILVQYKSNLKTVQLQVTMTAYIHRPHNARHPHHTVCAGAPGPVRLVKLEFSMYDPLLLHEFLVLQKRGDHCSSTTLLGRYGAEGGQVLAVTGRI